MLTHRTQVSAPSEKPTFRRPRAARWGGTPWLALAVGAACWPLAAQAQLFTYTFSDVVGPVGATPGSSSSAGGVASNLNFSSFTASGLTPGTTNAGNRFSMTGWDTGATGGSDIFTGAINLAKYFEFTITPSSGYALDLNSLNFVLQRSGTGIRQYAVRSSLDSFADNLAASIEPANTSLSVVPTNTFQVTDAVTNAQTGSTITLGSAFDALTTPITFRFYGFNAEGTGGTFSLDDVASFGSVTFLNARNLTWTPSAGTTWNSTATNWTLSGGGATAFLPGDNALFTDAGLALGSTVTIEPAGVTPTDVQVQNTSGTYTFTGGPLAATGTLTKTNAGTLVFDTTYTGSSLRIFGGTVRLNADSLVGDSTTMTIAGSSVFDLNDRSDTVGAITFDGGGTVQTGAGTLTLGGNITVTAAGGTPLVSGKLEAGAAPRTIATADGAADVDLQIDASVTGSQRITFAGTGSVLLTADNSGYGTGFTITTGLVRLGNKLALGLSELFLNGGFISATSALTGANAIPTPVSVAGNPILGGLFPLEFTGSWRTNFADARTITFNTAVTLTGGLNTNVTITKLGTGTLFLPTTASASNFVIGAGTVEITNPFALATPALAGTPISFAPAALTTATLNLKVPQISFPALSSSGAGTAAIVLGDSANLIDTELIVDTSGAAGTFGGNISVAAGRVGQFTKAGFSSLTLGGANTYNGLTTVNAGTLLVTGSLSGTSGVQVLNSSTVLGGSGTIGLAPGGKVSVEMGAILAPGDSTLGTGNLAVTGTALAGGNFTLTLASGSQFAFELGSPAVGGSQVPANAGFNDQVTLTGNVGLGGASLSGSLLFGFTAVTNDLFFLLINDGSDAVNGVFLDAPQNTVISLTGPEGSVDFRISYTGNSATNAFTGGNDVVLQALAAIPEPGSAALLATATGLLALRRRRAA